MQFGVMAEMRDKYQVQVKRWSDDELKAFEKAWLEVLTGRVGQGPALQEDCRPLPRLPQEVRHLGRLPGDEADLPEGAAPSGMSAPARWPAQQDRDQHEGPVRPPRHRLRQVKKWHTRNKRAAQAGARRPLGPLLILGLILAVVVVIATLPEHTRKELLYLAQDYLPIVMFLTLAALLFSGYPVAFVLGGVAVTFGLIGYFLGTFRLVEFFNFVPRIWGQAAENLVLVSIPTFIFMGVVMERSGIANDLLYCVQVLLEARARRAGAGRHHHGHDPRRHDRHHRRLGDHDDGAGAAHHDAAGLQPRAGLRHHRGGGNARNSHTAEYHADHHGRPARACRSATCSRRPSLPG